MGDGGVDAHAQADAPVAIGGGDEVPVRNYAGTLVNQLEAAFGLADGLDWEGPDISGLGALATCLRIENLGWLREKSDL